MAHLSIAGIFLANAGLSFALSLLLASLLGPEQFGRYALGLSVTIVVNTALFEWLRLSTTRFYSDTVRSERPAIRATLGTAYRNTAIVLAGAIGLGLTFGLDLGGSPALLAAAAGCGLTYGLCEYGMALSRARFLHRPFATLALGRGVLGFILTAGLALATRDPAAALAGAALSAAIVTVMTRRPLADPGAASVAPSRELLAGFARYGLPLVAASALYQLLPFANRWLLAGREGFAEAGYFSLASEIATRLFQNMGAALDLVLFQLAVRAEEAHGPEAATRQVERNAALVGAIVLPAAFGLALVWPAFEGVFVPEAFRGRVEAPTLFLLPALAAFALVQYAVNPAFQLRRRTGPVVAAAAVALAVDLAVVALWPGLGGASRFAAAQLAGMVAGTAVLCGLALRLGARLPLRDLALAGLAAGAMAAALWPTRGLGPPLLALPLQVAAGAALYGALAILLDIAGLGALLRRRRSGLNLA